MMNQYKYLLALFLFLLINQPIHSVIVELEVLKHKKNGHFVCAFGDSKLDIPTDAFGYGGTPGTSQKRDLLRVIAASKKAHIVAQDSVEAEYTDPDNPYTTAALLSELEEDHCANEEKFEYPCRFFYKGADIISPQTVKCTLLKGIVPLSANLGNSTYNAATDHRLLVDNIEEAIKKLGGFSALTYPKPIILDDQNPGDAPQETPAFLPLKPKEARGLLALSYIAKTKIKEKINSDPQYHFIHRFIDNNFARAIMYRDQFTAPDNIDLLPPATRLIAEMDYLVDTHFLHEVVKAEGKRDVFLLGDLKHTINTCEKLIEQGDYERIVLIEASRTPEWALRAIDIRKTVVRIGKAEDAKYVSRALPFCYQTTPTETYRGTYE